MIFRVPRTYPWPVFGPAKASSAALLGRFGVEGMPISKEIRQAGLHFALYPALNLFAISCEVKIQSHTVA